MPEEPPERPPLVDASAPSAPRVYDYLLGGKDNFATDRDLAERLEAQAPGRGGVREMARVNRRFILKAVTWSASMLGIGQFLDLGCGLPAKPAVHEAARDGEPGARVVYVDRDPVAVSHMAALQAGTGLAAVLADISVLPSVLECEAVRGLLDLRQPVCAVFGGTLSAMSADTARKAVAGYAEAMAPGSTVVISCVSYTDPEFAAKMEAMFGAAGEWRSHSPENVASFFLAANLRVVRGKVTDVRCWPMLATETPAARVLGGIGIKDRP